MIFTLCCVCMFAGVQPNMNSTEENPFVCASHSHLAVSTSAKFIIVAQYCRL